MHANVQWRHNPATGEEAPYYRLKESYRDVCGTVHSLVVLNIGFEPAPVLALCVNTAGFPRYSEILEGNTSDPKSLPEMVKRLSEKAAPDGSKPLVVIDAGIATEDNLLLLRENGFDYLCVSRTRPKDYELSADHTAVTVLDSRKQKITLREVRTEPSGDYLLEITSPSKAMTEASMNRQWRERFEGELEKIKAAIGKKGRDEELREGHRACGQGAGEIPLRCEILRY